MWGWGDDKRLGDWSVVSRHRRIAYSEGVRDGIVIGCIVSIAGGFILSWLLGKYWS